MIVMGDVAGFKVPKIVIRQNEIVCRSRPRHCLVSISPAIKLTMLRIQRPSNRSVLLSDLSQNFSLLILSYH